MKGGEGREKGEEGQEMCIKSRGTNCWLCCWVQEYYSCLLSQVRGARCDYDSNTSGSLGA